MDFGLIVYLLIGFGASVCLTICGNGSPEGYRHIPNMHERPATKNF